MLTENEKVELRDLLQNAFLLAQVSTFTMIGVHAFVRGVQTLKSEDNPSVVLASGLSNSVSLSTSEFEKLLCDVGKLMDLLGKACRTGPSHSQIEKIKLIRAQAIGCDVTSRMMGAAASIIGNKVHPTDPVVIEPDEMLDILERAYDVAQRETVKLSQGLHVGIPIFDREGLADMAKALFNCLCAQNDSRKEEDQIDPDLSSLNALAQKYYTSEEKGNGKPDASSLTAFEM